ncbi:hypothetical protein DTO164E3_5846 [Paecilomyces variotii]|nr:hypothetical protein DTO032I3_6446 [Paecilomyces variotii]KAJ9197132.1 hypothetical protein DTO164E3_5846 [Paecilomyces variotii]KAJ9219621.1 hypothetical protein DTO169C6_7995 [Paecilomyces variotii]KAJ9275103.1 hypothetical protein DTO021D3_8078 [Paecilomyces variotii]KAJ9341125.1 hypothetical protein DTO027B6_6257 [Paecilomyces variotii]
MEARDLLRLPEILQNVFEQLDSDGPSLFAVVQVNKTWFLNGIAVLWQKANTDALAQVSEERRQIYASCIHKLIFNGPGDEAYYMSFQDLVFTNLREVSIDSYRPKNGHRPNLLPLLPPTLEEFSFYGGDLGFEVLDHLRTNCRRLRSILIDSPGPDITPTAFLDFLRSCPILERLTFIIRMEPLLPPETILHLFSRKNLRSLEISAMINEELLDQISAAIDTPLPMIKRLILPITAPAIPTMITLLEPRHSLQELSFSIDGTTRDIVTPISRLTRLEKLEIKFRQKTELFSRDLTSLKQLTLLQKLSIVTDSWYGLNTAYIHAMDWTDTDFDAAISHMPHLRHLELHVQCPLSVAAMASLSHHCRSLETCEMPQIFNFNMWPDRDEIWFPNLQELCIGGFDNAGGDQNTQTDPGKFASKLKTKCPRLQDLDVGSEDPYTEAVAAAFNALD